VVHNASLAGNLDAAWGIGSIDMKRTQVEGIVRAVSIMTMKAIRRRECPGEEAWLQTLLASEEILILLALSRLP
jgi:hypothetical protein